MRTLLAPALRLCRLHRPVGILLILFPCWWGVALMSPHTLNLQLWFLFALGATVMRGAGCVLNDWMDQDFDRHVPRTKDRPLAKGELSTRHAMVLFSVLSLVGLGVLLMLPPRCWPLSLIGLGLLILYPLMKRITHWPQMVLGFAFNLGIIFGALAVLPFDTIPWGSVLTLYGAGIAWTLGYDTIYALQDKEHDLKIGVKSTAILFGDQVKLALVLIYGIMFILLAVVGYTLDKDMAYYILLILTTLGVGYALYRFDPSDLSACNKGFDLNPHLGWIIWMALLIG